MEYSMDYILLDDCHHAFAVINHDGDEDKFKKNISSAISNEKEFDIDEVNEVELRYQSDVDMYFLTVIRIDEDGDKFTYPLTLRPIAIYN